VKPTADGMALQPEGSPVERLLRAAAEYEPELTEPSILSAAGIALLLAKDANRRSRRTVRARMSTFAGVLAGAAACSASLVMAWGPSQPDEPARHPVQSIVAGPPANLKPATLVVAEVEAEPKRTKPARKVAVRRQRRTVVAGVKPAAVPVWTEETVEHQFAGVLTEGWIVQPNEDGSVTLSPAILDVMPGPSACEPPPPETEPLELEMVEPVEE
jgi:hypothetical protein